MQSVSFQKGDEGGKGVNSHFQVMIFGGGGGGGGAEEMMAASSGAVF